jgi:hypothetical protein
MKREEVLKVVFRCRKVEVVFFFSLKGNAARPKGLTPHLKSRRGGRGEVAPNVVFGFVHQIHTNKPGKRKDRNEGKNSTVELGKWLLFEKVLSYRQETTEHSDFKTILGKGGMQHGGKKKTES